MLRRIPTVARRALFSALAIAATVSCTLPWQPNRSESVEQLLARATEAGKSGGTSRAIGVVVAVLDGKRELPNSPNLVYVRAENGYAVAAPTAPHFIVANGIKFTRRADGTWASAPVPTAESMPPSTSSMARALKNPTLLGRDRCGPNLECYVVEGHPIERQRMVMWIDVKAANVYRMEVFTQADNPPGAEIHQVMEVTDIGKPIRL